MADILFSYSHQDREKVRPIVELLLDEGWDVWWDRDIEPGLEWKPNLEDALARTRAVFVAWSKFSKNSQWVHKEAQIGLEKNGLVQITIDKDSLPEAFSRYQATDLSQWAGRKDITEINTLLRRLAKIVPPSRIDTIRPGYNASFLSEKNQIILPGVTGPAAVFRYLHFSVVMNPSRRLAHYVAYNINGDQFINDSSFRRDALWVSDPLLAEPLQIDMALTRKSDYDRGHIVSPATVRWGDERSAIIAARQTYFWTNVSPQAPHLNQVSWLFLEQFERKMALSNGKITGFSGPVFGQDDKPYRDRIELEDGLVATETFHIPQAYWKVVVGLDTDQQLRIACFLVKQDYIPVKNKQVLKDYLVPLSLIEQLTHIRFGVELHQARSFDEAV